MKIRIICLSAEWAGLFTVPTNSIAYAKNENAAPLANYEFNFKTPGAGFIAGVDNGSEIRHESFKGNKHKALKGLALAILQSDGKNGNITLTASADGLEGTTVVVESR